VSIIPGKLRVVQRRSQTKIAILKSPHHIHFPQETTICKKKKLNIAMAQILADIAGN